MDMFTAYDSDCGHEYVPRTSGLAADLQTTPVKLTQLAQCNIKTIGAENQHTSV